MSTFLQWGTADKGKKKKNSAVLIDMSTSEKIIEGKKSKCFAYFSDREPVAKLARNTITRQAKKFEARPGIWEHIKKSS